MSDIDRDELLLNLAFDEFTTGSTPKINSEGTIGIKRRVARRRRFRWTIAVLVALAVGVPVAIWISHRTTHGTPTSRPSVATGLTRADVAGMRVGCPDGSTVVMQVVEANLDDDLELETAALLKCSQFFMVVGAERAPNGALVSLGTVAKAQMITSIARRDRVGDGIVITFDTGPQGYAWNGTKFVKIN